MALDAPWTPVCGDGAHPAIRSRPLQRAAERPRPSGETLERPPARDLDLDLELDRRPTAVVLWGLPALYAHGLRDALVETGHARVVAHEGEDLPALVRVAGSVVVVTGGALADHGALRRCRGVVVVELVADASVTAFTDAVVRGAVGVLEPGTELDQAVEVVAAASSGLVLVPDHVSEALATQRERTVAPSVSATERAWLRWLSTGGTVSALAVAGSYSEREMYRLLRRLYAHLGAGGRTDALLLAELWGLLDG